MKIFGMVTTKSSTPYTVPALESFFVNTTLSQEDSICLIDNDGAFGALPDTLKDRVTIIKNKSPLGFAANANQAIDLALGRNADLYFLNNDVIFPKEWIAPLLVNDRAILSPLSPREVQYAASVVNTKANSVLQTFIAMNPLDLGSYLATPSAFHYIAEVHRANTSGYWSVFVVPFFAVKIPLSILQTVGHFDVAYGAGGGEDYDYCLRAILAGFEVKYALSSYLLHFAGKSSWAGPEDIQRRKEREEHFFKVFQDKWGEKLFQLILREKSSLITESPELSELERSGRFKDVIARLAEKALPAIKI
jgi:GT2 family glycosyltransferase